MIYRTTVLLMISAIIGLVQVLEFRYPDKEYHYLPRHQGVMKYNLKTPLIIDRKLFRELWIYKNGFVTLGNALEEEAYPILTGTGKIKYQPFENLDGDSIIAVFIALNKDTADGRVRLREVSAKSMDGTNKESFIKAENIINSTFGQKVLRPMKSILIVEWIDVEVEGGMGKKNSFRLYVASSEMQSFAIIQYWNITSVSYKLFSGSNKYQSGIRSYANRNFILPYYNITDPGNTLTRTSNIEIWNTWLMNIGDLDYHVDLGFPIQRIEIRPEQKTSSIRSTSLSSSPKHMTLISSDPIIKVSIKKLPVPTDVSPNGTGWISQYFTSSLPDRPRSVQISDNVRPQTSTKSSSIDSSPRINNITLTALIYVTKATDGGSMGRVGKDHSTNVGSSTSRNSVPSDDSTESPHDRDSSLFTEYPSSKDDTTRAIDNSYTSKYYTIRNDNQKDYITMTTIDDPSSSKYSTITNDNLKEHVTMTTIDDTSSSKYSTISNDNQKDHITMKTIDDPSSTKYSTISNDNQKDHITMTTIDDTSSSKHSTIKDHKNNIMTTNSPAGGTEESLYHVKIPEKELHILTKNQPMPNDINKMSPSSYPYCHSSSCKSNEECFMAKDMPCCQCVAGSAHFGSGCYRTGDHIKIRSYGSVTIQVDGRTSVLDLDISTRSISNYQSIHLTLQSNKNIDLYLRNFILLLYPLFHIPIVFHAHSWTGQQVPNLSNLMSNKAAINIYIEVEGYGELYVIFRLDRSNDDLWSIFLKESLNSKIIRSLNLDNLKLDEKSTKSLHLNYSLIHKNSVDFHNNSVSFVDETKNRTISVKWRGSMTFTSSCLSDYIDTRNFIAKFSDTGYCNTDCIDSPERRCRLMCLATPYVFQYVPGPCEGNHCPNNMVCIDDGTRYDCRCPSGQVETSDNCVSSTTSSDELRRVNNRNKGQGCSKCSAISSCRILNSQACCICNTGFMGSGRSCYQRDGQFEIKGFGKLEVTKKTKKSVTPIDFRLLFRQWHSGSEISQATYVDTGKLNYSSLRQKDLAHLILLLSPVFDIPMSLFATARRGSGSTSIYAMSNGYLFLTVNIDGISPSRLSITFNITEDNDSLDIKVHILRSTSAINPIALKQAKDLFEKRVIPEIRYRVKGRQIILLPYSLSLNGNTSSHISMHVSGMGDMDECAVHEDIDDTFVVSTQQSIHCKTRCEDQFCEPYCQAEPVLKVATKESECIPTCHEKAKCIDSACLCTSGYSGDGLYCYQIKKTLECESTLDCNRRPNFECRNSTCLCKSGMVLRDNICVPIDPCQSCRENERCHERQCICRPQFERNRVSEQCNFDCSLCDVYSTSCTAEGCACKPKYVFETNSNVTCTLNCQSDSDCPMNEVCNSGNKCACATTRVEGICQATSVCHSCHRQAVCRHNKCQCLPNWIGDGTTCHYNCSLCFHPLFCDPLSGCSCPPDFVGDGKRCTEDICSKCPAYSRCENTVNGVLCQCAPGMVMDGHQCIKNKVQIEILPSEYITAVAGSQVELICIGSSKINDFKLTWIRKSGMSIKGHQNFLGDTNNTLRLEILSVGLDDLDEYICRASSGDFASVMVLLDEVKCVIPCHKYASCKHGKCQCNHKYSGNGISCVADSNCSRSCSPEMICNEKQGRCQCGKGFRQEKSKCVPDCMVQDQCDSNARCDPATGRCFCIEGFMGNGTKCWRKRLSCLLTKKCESHSSCVMVEDLRQDICVCDEGFIGDGDSCVRKMDCDRRPCGQYSFCEPAIVSDHLGNLHKNGRCTCEPGYRLIDDKCQDPRVSNKVLWMSMGEAVISLGANENKSVIQFIDTISDKAQDGLIITMAGDCARRRLYWSGRNGVTLRSASIDNITFASTLLSYNGKIAGITVDHVTGNVFFTDIYRGTITVLDPRRNISQVVIHERNYNPGQIVAHWPSGRLFWTVSDHLNPRIETSLMNGEQRREFVALSNRAISITVVSNILEEDRLCWLEVNDRNVTLTRSLNKRIHGFIKCTPIKNDGTEKVQKLFYKIESEEPSSAFIYSDKFYWGVQSGKFIRTLDKTLSKIAISPNCCDVRVRGLVLMSESCREDTVNPCLDITKTGCKHICVSKFKSKRESDYTCLKGNNL